VRVNAKDQAAALKRPDVGNLVVNQKAKLRKLKSKGGGSGVRELKYKEVHALLGKIGIETDQGYLDGEQTAEQETRSSKQKTTDQKKGSPGKDLSLLGRGGKGKKENVRGVWPSEGSPLTSQDSQPGKGLCN